MTVAQLGTVRAASAALGIHRATVTRHIDALENDLGIRLFLRHAEGYALTADGEALKRLADSTERLVESFLEDASTSQGELSGSLRISTLAHTAPLVMPAIRAFCSDHPNVLVNVFAESALTRLELRQADIALRTGPKPNNPDYVVVPFRQVPLRLFGHKGYFAAREIPRNLDDLEAHRLVATKSASGSIDMCDLFGLRQEALTMITNDPTVARDAVEAGIGLGLLAEPDPAASSLFVDVFPDATAHSVDVWIVTHVDLHRTTLLQTVLRYLRD